METQNLALPEPPRRFHFDWLLPMLFQPRRVFAKISEAGGSVWLTPVLVLVVLAIAREVAAGPIRQAAALSAAQNFSPEYNYYTDEQQAQFQQAQSAQAGPVFTYVFPALIAGLGAWLGWLLMVGLLHLTLTLLGGRGSTRAAMSLVAWASLPFAVRDLVRLAYYFGAHQLINAPGLSGFAPLGDDLLSLYLTSFMKSIDLYLLWYMLLLVLGVRAINKLSLGKTLSGVGLTLAVVLVLQALPDLALAKFSALTSIALF
jgi:hypothetical protein